MIRAVIFDFGGVLSRFGGAGDSSRRMAAVLGCAVERIKPELGPLIKRWLTGQVETTVFWTEAARLAGMAPRDFDAVWRAQEAREFVPEYYALAAALRAQGIRTGVLSDVGPTSAQLIRAVGGYDGFDPVLLSCEIGLTKHDPGIWQLLLDRLELPASEVLLVDDLAANLALARGAGIDGVRATTPAATVPAIHERVAWT